MQIEISRKRHLGPMDSTSTEINEFRLLKAPCSYVLTEMFDDRINQLEADEQGQWQLVTKKSTSSAASASHVREYFYRFKKSVYEFRNF